jgi:hypothetical protein
MTLNQIVKSLKDLIAANPFVRSCYEGEVSQWTELPEVIYPNILIVIGKVTPLGGEYAVDFTLYVSDLLEDGALNRLEVFSDALQICQDLAANFNDQERTPWIFELNTPFEFYDDTRGTDSSDYVGGVKMDFTLRVEYIKICSAQEPTRKIITNEAGLGIITEGGLDIITE